MRKPPRGKKRFCGVKLNEGGGGITKSFNTVAELVYSEFGEGWKDNIQCKQTQEPTQHQRQVQSKEKKRFKQQKKSGRNCLFEALSRALPQTNHRQVRWEIAQFYSSATNEQFETLSRRHTITDLRQRQEIIEEVSVWGEGVDISAVATIHRLAIRAVVVVAPNRGRVVISTQCPKDEGKKKQPDRNCETSTTTLYFNGLDHWSTL